MACKNQFWSSISRSLKFARGQSLFVTALVVLGLPIAESVLTELWSSAPADSKAAPGWTLVVVAAIHLVLGAFMLIEQACTQPHNVLARAFEVEDAASSRERELERRETAYRLMREAFDRLNLETCSIENAEDEAWCCAGFQKGLAPVLEPFVEKAALALGVVTTDFTLEVFFAGDIVPVKGTPAVPSSNGLFLHYFSGHHATAKDAMALDQHCSPARQCWEVGRPFYAHTRDMKHLFYDGGVAKEGVYFRTFAVSPISATCMDDMIGVLVLTSEQDSLFADDIFDVLAFLTTLISNYLSAYQRCFYAHDGFSVGGSAVQGASNEGARVH